MPPGATGTAGLRFDASVEYWAGAEIEQFRKRTFQPVSLIASSKNRQRQQWPTAEDHIELVSGSSTSVS
jgi:hypothetical protein